ncbi:hypothetical protein KDAU_53990 [Dictyobacter aurantiacus]|uniref:Uncharacterized protein n=1 Tax=Dictyobacter aurantiacus TaxID=1936993 RepID=A0A401ZMM5_9CHLR|nr:hypothetical protein KDAU_53990 [Dictyobacter aurantiacus]
MKGSPFGPGGSDVCAVLMCVFGSIGYFRLGTGSAREGRTYDDDYDDYDEFTDGASQGCPD